MEKINKKQSFLVLILFLEIIAVNIFNWQFYHTERPLLVFIPLLVLAIVYAPIYILQIKKREKGAQLIHYTIILSALIAALGGVANLAEYDDVGSILIVVSGIVNAIVTCWVLIYWLLRIRKKELRAKEKQIESFKVFLYAIPMWYFPFLVNFIVI